MVGERRRQRVCNRIYKRDCERKIIGVNKIPSNEGEIYNGLPSLIYYGNMTENLTSLSILSKVWAPVVSVIIAAFTTSAASIIAIILAAFFNVWCGMRADGVTVTRCKNFSWKEFYYAIKELLVYLIILCVVVLLCHIMGEVEVGKYSAKTIAWLIIVCYIINGLKNLCKAYPKSKVLWILYMFVQLDLTRILRLDELMKKYEERQKRLENE